MSSGASGSSGGTAADGSAGSASSSTSRGRGSGVHTVNNFLFSVGLDNINMFRLVRCNLQRVDGCNMP